MTITTKEAIDKLVDDDIDTIIQLNAFGNNEYIASILNYGFKGYVKFTKEELEKELFDRFEVKFKIKK
jgi:hypothetical protein